MSGSHLSVTNELQLNTIEEAVDAIRAGEVIIVVDDEDRENEGDFICAAECITPEIINFMATHGRGLICTPIDEGRADELKLHMMVTDNTALHETAFTVSIDLIGHGCTTGISAYDRATGIKALVNPKTKANDFARPGHIFPLRAKSGGVLRRTGHTEAAIDLAKMAGYYPAGVLVEILNEDGTMARLPQLGKLAEKHNLKLISIKDLVEYRMRNERIIKKELTVEVDSPYGPLQLTAYSQITTGDIHLAIKRGDWKPDEPVLVRVHSSTETGDILGTLLEGYGQQMHKAMQTMDEEGKGLLLYIHHGEKGNNILNKLKTYMEDNKDTPSTPGGMDQRDFGVGAQIIHDMGVRRLRLITKNPKRRIALDGYGLEIVEYVTL
ncbi:MAG: 3,4-dihydroxy-2-butanone-4-phosphate synthase [Bacteroidota bacterium]